MVLVCHFNRTSSLNTLSSFLFSRSCWAEWEVHHAFQKCCRHCSSEILNTPQEVMSHDTAEGDGTPFRIREGSKSLCKAKAKVPSSSAKRYSFLNSLCRAEELGGAPLFFCDKDSQSDFFFFAVFQVQCQPDLSE